MSGIFVIDVDGEEAHNALLNHLGKEPLAPKAISGSGKPYRYHLYFRCPDLPTKAKQTPWHPNLEFRGKGGIVIIPPSLHPSGKRYAWAPGQSPNAMEFSKVPSQVLNALTPLRPVKKAPRKSRIKPVAGIDTSPRTLEFLSGKWSEGPGWNDKLFHAACDLCGRDMPLEEGEPLLLAGAHPWSVGDEELARRTIASAYSQPRAQHIGEECGPKNALEVSNVDQFLVRGRSVDQKLRFVLVEHAVFQLENTIFLLTPNTTKPYKGYVVGVSFHDTTTPPKKDGPG